MIHRDGEPETAEKADMPATQESGLLATRSRRQIDVAVVQECDCPAKTCKPESNIDRFCWRTGCPIYARDFPQHGEQQ